MLLASHDFFQQNIPFNTHLYDDNLYDSCEFITDGLHMENLWIISVTLGIGDISK